MREDDYGCAGGEPFHVFFKPVELFLPKITQAALLDVSNIDQPDEVHPFLVGTVPSRPCITFSESFQVLCAVIVHVVLARNIEYILCSTLFEELGERVELLGSVRCVRSPVWSRNSNGFGNALMRMIASPSCPNDVRVCRFIKTNMAVADLDKVQFCRSYCISVVRFLAQRRGGQQSSVD